MEPGSPWENGYMESFIGKLRKELLKQEIITTLFEGKVLADVWGNQFSHSRPHRSPGYRLPLPGAIVPLRSLATET